MPMDDYHSPESGSGHLEIHVVLCPYCHVMARLVTGDTLYARRPDLWHLYFYLCDSCSAYVGTHKGTSKPLGSPANEELRLARRDAHAIFDQLWKSKRMSRSKAYKWLASELHINPKNCHIGGFDLTTCRRVVELCETQENDI